MTRHALRTALILAACGAAAHAQEPWSTGFRLVAGTFSGAVDAHLGQDKNFGLAMWGAYPLTRNASLEFEGGYRYFPATSTPGHRFKTDGYYGGAMYRHKLWFEGFYLQAGARVWALKAEEKVTVKEPDGDRTLVYKGPTDKAIKPVVGVGFRFNAHYSAQVNLAQAEFSNAFGGAKSGNVIEAALSVHF
jgi:hypothetical protein